jgi:hypothetical protein
MEVFSLSYKMHACERIDTSENAQSMSLSKVACVGLIVVISGSLLVATISPLESVRNYGISISLFAALIAVPTSVLITIIEWRRPNPAILWPLLLFFVSAVPLVLFTFSTLSNPK